MCENKNRMDGIRRNNYSFAYCRICFAGKYNSLVTANENINGKWSQVENNSKEERI